MKNRSAPVKSPSMYQGEVWSEGFGGAGLCYFRFCTRYLAWAVFVVRVVAFLCDHLGIIAEPLGIRWQVLQVHSKKINGEIRLFPKPSYQGLKQ